MGSRITLTAGSCALRLAIVTALVILSSGCSEEPSDPRSDGGAADAAVEPQRDVMSPDGSLPDISSPDGSEVDLRADLGLPDADGSTCTIDPVWKPDSARLQLTIHHFGVPPPLFDAGCPGGATRYEFLPGQRTLTETGCVEGEAVHRVARLSDGALSRLMTEIGALRTTCRERCFADAPTITLTLEDGSGCVRQAYDSNYEAECGGSLPPYLEGADLRRMEVTFHQAVVEACAPEGGTTDPGTCDLGDGGPGGICQGRTGAADATTDADGTALDVSDADRDDDGGDGDDGDDTGCQRVGTWSDASASFTLTKVGGLPAPGDAGCFKRVIYYFSLQSKTLVQAGCLGGRNGRRQIELVDEQVDRIVAAMTALRTTCNKTCDSDAPDVGLFVRDCSDRAEQIFSSGFHAACPGRMIAPPYIDFDAFRLLEDFLYTIITSSCEAGADAASPGMCGPYCRQRFD